MMRNSMRYDSKAPKECNERDKYGMTGKIITYCRDYGSEKCRKICTFAHERDKTLGKLERKVRK